MCTQEDRIDGSVTHWPGTGLHTREGNKHSMDSEMWRCKLFALSLSADF